MKVKDYVKKWQHTPYGRANHLLNSYRQSDKKANRGKCNLTTAWILENIFTKPCVHCGKEGWDVIGCNRLDNSKPHTMDNVEPCCKECNTDMWVNEVSKEVHQYTLDGELAKTWYSVADALRNGYCNISRCCCGKSKTANGYRWSYTPL